MTLARIIATGRGKLRARLVVEGWPAQWCTHASMVQPAGDGRERILGLKLDGIRIGARLDLAAGKVEAEGFRAVLVDVTPGRHVIRSLARKPQQRTYLREYVARSATTIPVFSTAGWPDEGVLHLNTETIRYTGKTADSFTGCTRGYWNTEPQAHFTQGTAAAFEADAAALAYPEVTDVPSALEGRRAWLYLYGDGDSVGGDGHLRWQGVCSTSPRFEGQRVSFSVDPPTSVLKQQIGGDVVNPVGIRGVYYPWTAPFTLVLTLCTSNVRYSPATTGTPTITVRVTGHYESQELFCLALTTAIASFASAASWPADVVIRARPTAEGFELVYATPSSGVRYVEINASYTDAGRWARTLSLSGDSLDAPLNGTWMNEETRVESDSLAVSARYVYRFASPVPRAYMGTDTPWARAGLALPSAAATAPPGRIYLGGLVALAAGILVAEEADPPAFTTITSYDSATQSINAGPPPTFRVFDPQTRFRLGRLLARGNVGTLIEALVAQSPDLANAGGMPLLREGDVNLEVPPSALAATALTEAAVARGISTPASTDRAFVALGQGATLEEIVGPELVAAGMHWTILPDGRLGARIARLAAATEPASFVIESGTTVGPMPTLEEAATYGFVSDLHYLTGYDVLEDDHAGPEIRFVNVRARAPGRNAKPLELAQKSIPGVRMGYGSPSGGVAGEPTQEDVAQIARFWLGLLGGSYDICSIRVSLVYLDAMLGDAVAVSSRYLPGPDGELGVTERLGILIGYQWDLESGAGTLELLMHSRDLAGYAPEFLVSLASGSGTAWTLELQLEPETTQPATRWFAVGDRVAVVEWDSLTPAVHEGILVDVDADYIEIAFSASWSPGSSTWTVRPQLSNEHAAGDNLARFAYVADDEGVVRGDGADLPARVFAP